MHRPIVLDKVFKPSSNVGYLTKIGSFFDGGYYLPNYNLYRIDNLVSIGCGGNIDFEYYLSMANLNCRCILIDRKISNFRDFFLRPLFHLFTLNRKFFFSTQQSLRFFHLLSQKKRLHFMQLEINNQNNIERIFNDANMSPCKVNLLKIDIEGAEYFILKQVLDSANLFSVIIIEFHEIAKNLNEIQQFIDGIKIKGFHLVSTVINECVRPIGEILELTFSRDTNYENESEGCNFHVHKMSDVANTYYPVYQ